jgi:RNA polymerase-binding transcription factor
MGTTTAARQDDMAKKVTTSSTSSSSTKSAAKAAAKAPAERPVTGADEAASAPAETVAPEQAATQPQSVAESEVPAERAEFLASQRRLLLDERANYIRSADSLKAQADSLALEHEPGDVQFDEEGGEGGTSNVDRELDLILSAQARAVAGEIDRALAKIDSGTYGLCEQCGQQIPDARLQALPQAALCVACKSGGLSSRR